MFDDSALATRGLERLFGPASEEGGIPLSAIRERASLQLDEFARLAQARLAERGIAIPPPVNLVSAGDGTLSLEGRHPQAAAIEAWLSGNAEVARKFKEVEVLYEVVRAAEQPDQVLPDAVYFHIGLTSAGPVAYFGDAVCPC